MKVVIDDVQQIVSRAPAGAGNGVHRVLVAFDGSPGAWAALDRAIDLAVANRALLTIAAVAEEPIAMWLGFGAMSVPYTRETIRLEAESACTAGRKLGSRDSRPTRCSMKSAVSGR